MPLRRLTLLLVMSLSAAAVAAPEIALRPGLPLLFADDSGVGASAGVTRTVHPARTRPEPVLEADRPWEGQRVYTYGSIHFDAATGLFRLWYMSRSQDPGPPPAPQLRSGGQDIVLYATSPDGIRWTKPALGLHAYRGSTANNIVADLHTPSVVVDAFERDPARRLKLLGYHRGGYYAAWSADGLRWTEHPGNPVFKGNDTMTLTQDPRTGEFLAYFKQSSPTVPGRVVWLTRSRDFTTWSEPRLVFHGDAEDDRWARSPQQRTEVYNMAVYPHAAGFIGLPAMFRVISRTEKAEAKLPKSQSGNDGPIDIQLATSADGERWVRSQPRVPIIPRGAPGTFDGGALLGVSSTALHAADATWVLYTAINTGHGGPIPPKRLTIGRAEWRLHGWVSLDAGPTGGRVETLPLRLAGTALLVNADSARGELRAALLEADGRPIAGFALADCTPLRADATRHAVLWRGSAPVPTDRPVRVVLEFDNTRLYSLATAP